MKKKKSNRNLLYLLLLFIIVLTIFGSKYFIRKNNDVLPPLKLTNYKEYFTFPGNLLNEYNINDRYVSLLYEDNGQKVSHLIDLKNKKEIDLYDLLKKNKYELYDEKMNELLALKYPTAICQILKKSDKAYYFDNEKLTIYYNLPDDIVTTRDFDLKINYVEIKDYINFETELNYEYVNENGQKYDPNKVSIAFTFDDGPNDEKTLRLVEALESYHMSATFFMVGNKIASQSSVVKRVNDSHSEVGYHSYAHTRFTYQSVETIQNEFNMSNELFHSITGNYLKLTRPPYGSYNTIVLSAIDNAFIRWNIDTNDWQYKDVDYIVNYVMDNLKDRSIILFHDSYETSVEAAIKLMEKLYFNDVQVLSVSELANLTNTPLENHHVYFSFN